ncbi:GNAT family N-acetyltransferase [Emticicia sp. 21SJ11W-3]|uniref:GNAT family N-acetyltransferase n=1 Tax=Emticicia sp. 21SJ11W-3 TaxID=2916755 RepID=UPI00209EC9D1|nr:GNAT family protein [Emticicia sp. 21SJ11W-3]UTA67928.1 GNAT family N-acetyltransferase [Emticicia sp. 21SJ11W-3]
MNFFLRKWQAGDEPSLAENANNYRIWRNLKDIFPHPYTITDAFEWVKLARNTSENYAIVVENKAVGGIGILLKDDIYCRNAEIGYWLGEPYWNKGIMSAAIEEVTDFTFANYPIHRIYAGVFEYNTGSMRALQKAGYEKEAVLKHALFKEGQLYDEHIFARYRP